MYDKHIDTKLNVSNNIQDDKTIRDTKIQG